MKKLISTMILAAACTLAFGQAKKPTLMVVPSDTWCSEYGFTKQFDVDGDTKTVPDYENAFLKNGDLKIAITTIGDLMQERGFPLKDMEQTIKSINQTAAEDMVTTTKGGGSIWETPIDRIKKRAKCDIILELYWKVNSIGPRKSVTYNLRALDAYTNKQVGAMNGASDPTMTADLAMMLKSAMTGGIDAFNNGLMTYFTDMAENGREISFNIRVSDISDVNLEDEFKGEILTDYIEDWVSKNTMNNSYNLSDATESMMTFEQVRIPLYDDKDRALDARRWANGLARELRSDGMDVKITMQGLGLATIIINGKK